MANGSGKLGGIGLGGILLIVGVLLAIFWSVWIGIIIALVGLECRKGVDCNELSGCDRR